MILTPFVENTISIELGLYCSKHCISTVEATVDATVPPGFTTMIFARSELEGCFVYVCVCSLYVSWAMFCCMWVFFGLES
jgi:hypothetical protein